MKNKYFIIPLTAALFLSACGEAEADIDENTAVSAVGETTADETEETCEAADVSREIPETDQTSADTKYLHTAGTVSYHNERHTELREYSPVRPYDITDKCTVCDLDDDIKELFNQAHFIKLEILSLRNTEWAGLDYDTDNKVAVEFNGIWGGTYITDMFASGCTFDSFRDYVEKPFTDKYRDECISSDSDECIQFYYNINGECCYFDGGRGYRVVRDAAITTTDKTEDSIRFHAVVNYDDDVDYTIEYDYDVVNTPEGWKFDSFYIWE